MYIKALELHNFRSFQKLDRLDLSEQINVFVGKNDSGKSALLESVQVLTGQLSRMTSDVFNDENALHISSQVNDWTTKDFAGGTERIKGSVVHIRCEFSRSETMPTILINSDGGQFSFQGGSALTSSRPNSPIVYFSGRRDLSSSSQIGKQPYSEVNPSANNAAAVIDELTGPASRKRLEFDSVMNDLLGYEVGVVSDQASSKKIGRTNNSGTQISADRMGSGISELAYLVAHLVVCESKVLVIDELERSYHPDLLKRIIKIIRERAVRNKLQFLVGTHSNIVLSQLAAVEGSKVFETYLNENETSSVREINSPEDRQRVMIDLGYTLGDLECYEGFIITEESTAQSFIEKLLIPKFFPDLSTKIKVVAADGADDVKTRYNMLGKIYVFQYLNSAYTDSTWVICDGDNKGKRIISELSKDFPRRTGFLLNLEDGKQIEHYYPKGQLDSFLSEHDLNGLEALYQLPNDEKRRLKKELLLRVLAEGANQKDLRKSAKHIIGLLDIVASKNPMPAARLANQDSSLLQIN